MLLYRLQSEIADAATSSLHRVSNAHEAVGGYDALQESWPLRQESSFSAAVFAGGASTRMGTDKAFLRSGDELLIERQLRCLRDTGASQLLISGRAEVDYSHLGLMVVHDEIPGAGPLAGLTAVLRASTFEKTLVLGVDMPAMTPRMLKKVVFLSAKTLGCVLFDDRGFEPFAAVYSRQQLPLAEELLAAGRYSMRNFVKEGVSRGLTLTLEIEPGERHYFINCNRLADWTDFCDSSRAISPSRHEPRRED